MYLINIHHRSRRRWQDAR